MGKRGGLIYVLKQRFEELQRSGKQSIQKEVVALPSEKGVSNEHRSHPSNDQSNAFDVIMRFGSWARETHAVKDLDHLQKRVEELTLVSNFG